MLKKKRGLNYFFACLSFFSCFVEHVELFFRGRRAYLAIKVSLLISRDNVLQILFFVFIIFLVWMLFQFDMTFSLRGLVLFSSRTMAYLVIKLNFPASNVY